MSCVVSRPPSCAHSHEPFTVHFTLAGHAKLAGTAGLAKLAGHADDVDTNAWDGGELCTLTLQIPES